MEATISSVTSFGADHEIGVAYEPRDLVVRRDGCADRALKAALEVSQPRDREVDDRDVSAHAEGVGRGMLTRHSSPDHDDRRPRGPGDAAEEGAPPAGRSHEVVRADEGGQSAGDLAHGRQQRQAPVRQLDRLVRDGRRARRHDGLGARTRRREVQVREENLVGAHRRVLRLDGLLDLEEEFRLAPDRLGPVDDRGTRRRELVVRERGAETRAGLDQHVVAAPDELVDARRRHRHPVLVVLDLRGNSDQHGCLLVSTRRSRGFCNCPDEFERAR
jgi:hypothetical protein